MTYAMTPLLKPYECCCIASVPTPFAITTTKPSFPFLSLPSKPVKLTHLCFSSSPSWVSNPKISQSLLVPLVAQTSDWAHQEEEVQEDRPVDRFRAVDDTDAGSSLSLQGEGEEEERGEENEDSYAEPPEEAKLFVGNLPYDIDSEKLAHLFNQAGVVEISEVIYNRETDQSRGFGFVTMSTVEEAEKAVEMFHRYDLNGRLLTVNKAGPRGSRPERLPQVFEPSVRIYVGNLPWQVDKARLEQVFSEYGKVIDARVLYDRETGRSRGFGFVTMSSETEVHDAIAALDGQSLDGRAIRVNVAQERPRRSSF